MIRAADQTTKLFVLLPEPEDLVLSPYVARGSRVYALRMVPGLPQILIRDRLLAIEHAEALATRHALRVWIEDEHLSTAVLLYDYRDARGSATAGSQRPHEASLTRAHAQLLAVCRETLRVCRAADAAWRQARRGPPAMPEDDAERQRRLADLAVRRQREILIAARR